MFVFHTNNDGNDDIECQVPFLETLNGSFEGGFRTKFLLTWLKMLCTVLFYSDFFFQFSNDV